MFVKSSACPSLHLAFTFLLAIKLYLAYIASTKSSAVCTAVNLRLSVISVEVVDTWN